MPTYNYRLTGRDIKTLSPVESTDRVLLWGAASVHCGHAGCRFEICAVGDENVMGGAMQEGWGLKDLGDEKNEIDVTRPPAITLEDDCTLSPWRCAIHLTDEHNPITPEIIRKYCPDPPSLEYQRGHADGFEQAHEAIKNRPAFQPMANTGALDIPSAEELASVIQSRGGLMAIAPLLTEFGLKFSQSEKGESLFVALEGMTQASRLTVQTIFFMAAILSSLYFNDKYAAQVQAGADKEMRVQ